MAFRVLIADQLAKEGLEVFKAAKGLDVVDRAGIDKNELLKVLPDFDALVVRSATQVDAQVISAGTKLKVIGRAGIGVDNVDVKAATRAGVIVMNTPEGNATTTAEHAISLMFAMARKIPQATASMKAGKWDKKSFMGRELCGKNIGVLGLGNIGRIVADRALGMKMHVLGFDPFFDAAAAAKLGIEMVSLEDLMRRSDIITVHTPLTPETKGLVGDKQIDLMKPGVMLINCARGGIYDEGALLRGLQSNKIGALALDVFVDEPPAKDHPLVNHERVICTPHLGASTTEAQVQVAIAIAEQIVNYVGGQAPRNAVNLPRVSAADLKILGPYLDLAERMGSFCSQLGRGSVQRIEIELSGEVVQKPTTPLVAQVIAGALQHAFNRSVNAVNAQVLAEERGIKVVEAKSQKPHAAYASSIRVAIDGQEKHSVVGTLFEGGEGRFVEVDGVRLEAVPEGHILFIHNKNQPGVIGHIGTVLGDAGINISRMHLGLERRKDEALSLVSIDQPPPDSVIKDLQQGAILTVRHIHLN